MDDNSRTSSPGFKNSETFSKFKLSQALEAYSSASCSKNPEIEKLFQNSPARQTSGSASSNIFLKPTPPPAANSANPGPSPVSNNTRLGSKIKLLRMSQFSPKDLAFIPSGRRNEVVRKIEALNRSKIISKKARLAVSTAIRAPKVRKKKPADLYVLSSSSSSQASPVAPPTPADAFQLANEDSTDSKIDSEVLANDSQTSVPQVLAVPEPTLSVEDSQVPSASTENSATVAREFPCTFVASPSLEARPPSTVCRSGKKLYILLPILSHPYCPEKGCKHLFATDRLNNLCSAIDIHFRDAHNIHGINIKKLCDYCEKEVGDDPRPHGCFENSSYFNIDYSNYVFKHKCKKCNFSTWEYKWIQRHKCFYSLQKRTSPPPKSIAFSLSPFANISAENSVLADEVATSPPGQVPFASVTQDPITTAISPSSSKIPHLSPRLQPDDIQDSIEDLNTQSSPQALQIPPGPERVVSPAHVTTNIQSSALWPGDTCRVLADLHIVLPMNNFFRCTEAGCSKTIYSGDFSSAKGNLVKHLRRSHGHFGLTNVIWCSFCQQQLSEKKFSSHECLKGSSYYNIDFSILPFNNKCPRCPFNTDSSKGLSNHMNYHRRKDSKLKKYQSTTTAQGPSVPEVSPPSSPASSNASSATSVTGNDAPLSPGSELNSSTFIRSQVIIPPGSQVNESLEDQPDADVPPLDDGMRHVLREIEETPNPDDPSPSADFCRKFKDILTSDSSGEWEEFSSLLENYIEFIQKRVKIPTLEKPRTYRKSNPRNKTFIQRLYKRNRRRAVRLILGQAMGSCDLEPDALAEHFFPDSDFTPDASIFEKITAADAEVDLSKFSPEEVWTKLGRAENTAPGPDRLSFQHWKSSDPEAKTLACIFNICLKYQKIPDSWKTSKTVFIPKNEAGDSLSDWRPISLCSTISKLFSSCLSKRLINWILENKILSSAQKGFLPYDGAFENNYILQAKINEARKTNSQICIASIDISNAFGNIPHAAIKEVLKRSGAGQKLIDLVSALIDNAFTTICTNAGLSIPRKIKRGVKQGDPISGLLFNLAIEPLIRLLNSLAEKLNILAFADDIILIAESIEELMVYLSELFEACAKLGLSINPKKCYTMHLSPSPRGCLPTEFRIGGETIPYILDSDEKKFLGKPIGFQVVSDYADLNSYKESALSILESSLAFWQKIDALKAFVYPSFAYAQRTAQIKKTDWAKLDNEIRHGIKQALCVPGRAANEYLYGHQKDGLFGIPIAAEDSDIAHIDGAFKLLSSKDPHTKEFAWKEFRSVVEATMPNPISHHHFSAYLSNEVLHKDSGMPASIWSKARKASGHLKVDWEFHEDLKFSITSGDTTIADRSKVFHLLRDLFKSERSIALQQKPHQGKTAACISKAKASSHFNSNGKFIRFTDWRFIHRARLGLVDLNGYKRDVPIDEKYCRRCIDDSGNPHIETLPHVINNCKRNMKKITERHDEILFHIRKAALARDWKIYSENRAIAGSTLRPDLVIHKESSVIIFDAQVTFENGEGALDRSRKLKLEKYAAIAKKLKDSFTEVSIAPIILGSLGSWDPKNDRHLLRICSKKYLNLMRKLIVSDTVRHSRDIFIEHTWGIKQIQPTRYYPNKRIPVSNLHSSSQDELLSVPAHSGNEDPPRELSSTMLPESPNSTHAAADTNVRELSSNMLPESPNSSHADAEMIVRELSSNALPESHNSAHATENDIPVIDAAKPIPAKNMLYSHVVVADVHINRQLESISAASPSPSQTGTSSQLLGVPVCK